MEYAGRCRHQGDGRSEAAPHAADRVIDFRYRAAAAPLILRLQRVDTAAQVVVRCLVAALPVQAARYPLTHAAVVTQAPRPEAPDRDVPQDPRAHPRCRELPVVHRPSPGGERFSMTIQRDRLPGRRPRARSRPDAPPPRRRTGVPEWLAGQDRGAEALSRLGAPRGGEPGVTRRAPPTQTTYGVHRAAPRSAPIPWRACQTQVGRWPLASDR